MYRGKQYQTTNHPFLLNQSQASDEPTLKLSGGKGVFQCVVLFV